MEFLVEILILPHPQLLDPQGKATLHGLKQLGLKAITDARVGKRIRLTIQADHEAVAMSIAQEAAQKLLANPITEVFELRLLLPETT